MVFFAFADLEYFYLLLLCHLVSFSFVAGFELDADKIKKMGVHS